MEAGDGEVARLCFVAAETESEKQKMRSAGSTVS
jgi:hypothetical protein